VDSELKNISRYDFLVTHTIINARKVFGVSISKDDIKLEDPGTLKMVFDKMLISSSTSQQYKTLVELVKLWQENGKTIEASTADSNLLLSLNQVISGSASLIDTLFTPTDEVFREMWFTLYFNCLAVSR
jgi:hypothetical protein